MPHDVWVPACAGMTFEYDARSTHPKTARMVG